MPPHVFPAVDRHAQSDHPDEHDRHRPVRFFGAATSPYQSVVGITELGLSDGFYSALIFAAALVNVAVSVTIGIVADRVGNYRTLMLAVILCGVVGYGAVYLLPTKGSFVLAALMLLPVHGALNPLLFAYVRTAAKEMGGRHAAAVNSGIRAAISLSWVLVPGLVGLVLSARGSMLPAYLLASLGCLANFVLVLRLLPERRAWTVLWANASRFSRPSARYYRCAFWHGFSPSP